MHDLEWAIMTLAYEKQGRRVRMSEALDDPVAKGSRAREVGAMSDRTSVKTGC